MGNTEERQRRAKRLAAFSFVIIVYVISGGSINGGVFFGGGVTFEKPELLEYAALIIFMFSVYRYCLAIGNPFKNFTYYLNSHLSKDNEIREYVEENAQAEVDSALKNNRQIGEIDLNAQPRKHRPFSAVWEHRQHMQWKSMTPYATVNINSSNRTNVAQFLLPIYPLAIYKPIVKGCVKTLFVTDSFWDEVFPGILALIASAFVALRLMGLAFTGSMEVMC